MSRVSSLNPLRRAAVLVASAGLFVTACGDDTDTADSAVEVTGAWARTSPMSASVGAVYFSITSPADDAITAVAVDSTVADHAEMHETVMAEPTGTTMDMGAGMGSETTMHMGSDTTMPMGQMTMQPVDSIELPGGSTVELKPGGLHIMLIDLVAPLEVGTTITLTLTLRDAGEVVIEVPVLDEAP